MSFAASNCLPTEPHSRTEEIEPGLDDFASYLRDVQDPWPEYVRNYFESFEYVKIALVGRCSSCMSLIYSSTRAADLSRRRLPAHAGARAREVVTSRRVFQLRSRSSAELKPRCVFVRSVRAVLEYFVQSCVGIATGLSGDAQTAYPFLYLKVRLVEKVLASRDIACSAPLCGLDRRQSPFCLRLVAVLPGRRKFRRSRATVWFQHASARADRDSESFAPISLRGSRYRAAAEIFAGPAPLFPKRTPTSLTAVPQDV